MTDGDDDSEPISIEIWFGKRSTFSRCGHGGDGDGANEIEMVIAQQSTYRGLLEVDYPLY